MNVYSGEDVRRLRLIKTLDKKDHFIGAIARLDREAHPASGLDWETYKKLALCGA